MGKAKLQKYRKFLVTYEMLALLHDIGKLNDSIIVDEKIIHPFMSHIKVALEEFKFEYSSNRGVKKEYVQKMLANKSDVEFDYDTQFPNFRELMKTDWSELMIDCPDRILTSLTGKKEFNRIGQVATHHQYKNYAMPNSILELLTCEADSLDAAEDRTYSPFGTKGLPGFYVSSPFGREIVRSENEERDKEYKSNLELRLEIYQKIDEIIKTYGKGKMFLCDASDDEVKECRQKIYDLKDYFSKVAAMTRIPDNDTTLWNHSFMTASIGKALIGNFLLRDEDEKDEIAEIFTQLKNIKRNKEEKSKEKKEKNKGKNHQNEKENKPKAYFIIHKDKLEIKKNLKNVDKDKEEYILENKNSYKIHFKDKNNKEKIYYSVVTTYSKNKSCPSKTQIGFQTNRGETKDVRYFYLNEVFGSGWKINIMDCLLGTPHVLAVQFPGREFLTNVYRLPDFIAREKIMEDIRGEIKDLLEFTIPVGNCVFEDINGMYFLAPDLNLDKELIEEITVEIENIFQRKTRDLIMPTVLLEPCDLSKKKFLIGPTITMLRGRYENNSELEITPYKMQKLRIPTWTDQWTQGLKEEICVVCGKKPGKKDSYNDIICSDCKKWRFEAIEKNIEVKMIDQIKDKNDRIALLVGEVGLYDLWLDGSYVKTTTNYRYDYKKDDISDGEEEITAADLVLKTKEPSPARLMRIIEEIDEFIGKLIVRDNLPGLNGIVMRGKLSENCSGYYEHQLNMAILDKILLNNLDKYCGIECNMEKTYISELSQTIKNRFTDHGKGTVEIICQEEDFEFVFSYPEKIQLGDKEFSILWRKLFEDYWNELNSLNKNFIKKKSSNRKDKISIRTIDEKTVKKYRVIYTKADQFMIILPADQAVEVAKDLEMEFNKRFNKVQGRLSLNMGLILADCKYPLYLVLKAGKVMMENIKMMFPEKQVKVNKDLEIHAKGLSGKIMQADTLKDDSVLKVEIGFEQEPFNKDTTEVLFNRKIKPYEPYQDNEKGEYDLFYPYFLDKDGKGMKVIYISDEEKYEISGELKKRKEAYLEKNKEKNKKSNKKNNKKTKKEISLSDDFKITSEHFEHLKNPEIIYAPNTIDFENLITNGSRSGLNLEFKSSVGKRKHYISDKFRVRPYLANNLWELVSLKAEFLRENISSGILVRLSQAFLYEISFIDNFKEEEILLDGIIDMLIGNISDLKNLDAAVKDKLSNLMKTGQIFDLVELWSTLNII